MATRTWTRTLVAAALAVLAIAGVAMAARGGRHGSLDKSFGRGGTATLHPQTRLFAVALQSDGKIVAVGEAGVGTKARVLVARFTSRGSLDRSFGRGGLVQGPAVHTTHGSGSIGRAVAIQRDGKIVVVGKATSGDASGRFGLLIERYTAGGRLDPSFGSRGVTNMLSSSFGDGYAVTILPSGKIVATGSNDVTGSGNGKFPRAAVVRLSANGRPDSSFGKRGVAVFDLGPYSSALAVAAAPNGKLVIVGSQSPGLQATNALVARLTPSGALDRSFHGTGSFGHQYAQRGGAFSAFNAVVMQPGGKIVAVGSATGATGTASMLAVRFGPSGGQDGSFGSGGTTYVQSARHWSETKDVVPGGAAVAIAPNREIIVAGQFDDSLLSSATLWALTPGGRPDRSFGSNGVARLKMRLGANSEAAGVAAGRSGTVLVGDAQVLEKPITGLIARFH